ILDPHSDVTPALINNCRLIDQSKIFAHLHGNRYTALICPDAGATKRTEKYAQEIGISKIYYASKKRDVLTGKLDGFRMPEIDRREKLLLVDDICDYGNSFIGLGKLVPKHSNIDLFVSHGIFGAGLDNLLRV